MNILFITPELFPYQNEGGVATFSRALISLIEGLGHKVFIITYSSKRKMNPKKERVWFITQPSPSKHWLAKKFDRFNSIVHWNNEAKKLFDEIIKKNSIDIIHTNLYFAPALFLSKQKKKLPLIAHAHGESWLTNPRMNLEIMLISLLELWQFFKADQVVFCSKLLKKQFGFLGSLPKSLWIPNPLLGVTKRPLLYSSKPKNLLYFGRLSYQKGTDIVVQAFKQLLKTHPSLELFLIGDSDFMISNNTHIPFEEWLGNFFSTDKTLKEKIHVINRVDSKTKLFNLISSKSPLILAPCRYDPFGYVVLESLSQGFLTVGSSATGHTEIITKHSGYLTSPNSSSVTHVIERILRSPLKGLRSVSLSATVRAKEFDARNIRQYYKKIYARLSPT